MANEVVTIRINVSADTRDIDKVKRKLASLSAQSAVTGGDVGDLADEVDRVGGSSRKSSRDIDSMSRSTERFGRNSRGASSSLTGMSKVFDGFITKLGGIGMFTLKAWMIQTALLGAGLVSIAAGFKIAAAAGKLFQASMAAVAAGAAAAVVAVTTAAAAYRQYIAATNAVNYTAGPMGSRQNEAMGAFRAIQSDKELGSLGVTSVNAAFAGISQQTAFTGDMKESLKSLADFAVASGDIEKGMAAAGQFLGALRKEGKITDQVAALGEGLGGEFQTALQEAVKTGKISEVDFLSALNAGSLNQKVVGLLDGVNQTLFGQAKSFMSEAISMAGDIGQTFLPDVQVAFDKMTSILRVAFLRIGADLGSFASGDFVNTIVSATQKISDFTVNLFEKYLPKADGMLSKLGKSWNETKNWFRGFRDTLDELKVGGQILIDTFKPFFREFVGGFGEGFKSFNKLIVDNKDKFMEFGDALGGAWDALQKVGEALRKAFVNSLPSISRVLNLLEKLLTVISAIIGGLGGNSLSAPFALFGSMLAFAGMKKGSKGAIGNMLLGQRASDKRSGGMLPMIFGGGRQGGGKTGLSLRDRARMGYQSVFGGRQTDAGMGSTPMSIRAADQLRSYRLQRKYPGAFDLPSWRGGLPKGVEGPKLPTAGQRMMGRVGGFAPYALMGGSLFGSEEAQTPMMAGSMVSMMNPQMGLAVAGLGTATTSKTKMGGVVSGAAGGAALGGKAGPWAALGGAIVGGIYGGVMSAVNNKKANLELGTALVDSTRKGMKGLRETLELAADPKEARKALGESKKAGSDLAKAAELLANDKDIQAFREMWKKSGRGKSDIFDKTQTTSEMARSFTPGQLEQYERGRSKMQRAIALRESGLKTQMKAGVLSKEDAAQLRKYIGVGGVGDFGADKANQMSQETQIAYNKYLEREAKFTSNVEALSRATGLGAEEIQGMAADAGVNLYNAGMNLAETISEIGVNLPTTFEEASQQFRGKAFEAIEDIFTSEIEANAAQKAIDQIGEDVRNTRGALAPDASLEITRDLFNQATAMFPKNPAETIRMLEGFLPGGIQYGKGAAFEGRQGQMPTQKIQQGVETLKGIQVTDTANLLSSTIRTLTGGKSNVDVNKLQPQLVQLPPETLSALQLSATAAAKTAETTGPTATGFEQAFSQIMGAGGLSGISLQFTDAATQAATTMTSGLANAGPLLGASLYNGFSTNLSGAGLTLAQPLTTNSTSIGQGVSNGFGFGAAGHGATIGNAAAGPIGSAVASAIAANPLKVGPIPTVQVQVNTSSATDKDGDGKPPDTTSSRLASTMARHRSMNGILAGKRSITSSLRSSNLGSLGSDHATGNAYDLVGQNLGAYQQLVQSSGGFAEFHNGGGRHLHVVPGPGVPAGDSATPAMVSAGPAMATTSNNPVYNISVNGGNASAEAIADTVMAKIAEKERSMKERS